MFGIVPDTPMRAPGECIRRNSPAVELASAGGLSVIIYSPSFIYLFIFAIVTEVMLPS